MAAHYIGTISNSLMQFDPTLTQTQAEALAWTGLKAGVNADADSEIDSQTGLVVDPVTGANESSIAWYNKTQSERLNLNQIREQFIQNHPPCQ